MMVLDPNYGRRTLPLRGLLCASSALALVAAAPALAQAQPNSPTAQQDQPLEPLSTQPAPPTGGATEKGPSSGAGTEGEPQEGEEILVTGTRATQRNSAEVKRQATVIVDAIVSDEIGALPDQSVAETLERITGVTSDRFKGSASEISVRGLGPFLGFSTLNGREVSSGSGDRAVSFQQFPSELVNGVLVYKTQQADFVEGGVSGVIELRTLRPLDFNRQRLQLDVRGVYNPYDDRIVGRDGLGYRGAASFTDQFDTGIGRIGIALGYSRVDSTQPEDFYTASSTIRPCNSVAANPNTNGDCTFSATSSNPFYFVPNQYVFRQLSTSDERDAFIGAVQWRPNDQLDINLDAQWSSRRSFEDRHDLVIAEARRGIRPTTIADEGALLEFSGNSRIESQNRLRARDEDYLGGGLAVAWSNDRLTLSTDLSYSETHRNQVDRSTRLRTSTTSGFSSGRVPYTYELTGDVPSITFAPAFDVTNHAVFNDAGYARREMEDRRDEILAGRVDALYDLGDGFIESVKVGARYSDHRRATDLDNQNFIDPLPSSTANALEAAANANCRIPFPQRSFLRRGGTNINSFATFDGLCVYRTFAGIEDVGPADDPRSISDINVRERISAGYAMANFRSEGSSVPFSGNVGIRLVHTDVVSRGFRGAFDVVNNPDGTIRLNPTGEFEDVSIKNDFLEVLPSLNVAFELQRNLLLRGAVYRALARSNIEDMGAGREFSIDNEEATSIEEAISGVSGGNPRLGALVAWNGDLSLEWYPNKDTLLAGAVFYKRFSAGIIPARENSVEETFEVDGVSFTLPVAQQTNSRESNNLYGFEVTAQHAFTYLPGLLSGFGFVLNYSYADSDFEYEDPSAVNAANPLRNFTDPVGIQGLSKHTGSATVYWEMSGLSLRALYKYRSSYFKPSGLTANRSVEAAGYLDLSASYNLTENVQVRLQALNVLDENQVMYRPVPGANTDVSYFGPSYFFGLRFRL